MKEKELKTTPGFERKLREQVLLGRRVEGDHLMLSDAVINAALDGSRPLTANEREALARSPLTMRRFRQLSNDRLANERAAIDRAAAELWRGSTGLLRAASTDTELSELLTDDGHWALHFLPQDGGWQVILKLAADAPFAAALMREQPLLRVSDGGGTVILQGRLDADGECEDAWPFDAAPAPHFQQFGARFSVDPLRSGAP
jgi:hypothetical protein